MVVDASFVVPVIGVFTKYDQFKLDVEMDLEDGKIDALETSETLFKKYYLCHLSGARFVQLESVFRGQFLSFVLMLFCQECISLMGLANILLKRQLKH